ncbi:M16 family metallopeptidase [Bacteroides caecigallinarum]|uniref:M16 family metallopeptidase n=1 Tax=Bacteroides caecigallinarum TaxID=1411144 RepID=UPI001F2B7A8F|nr:M16 family metallopeptidase [Bacteroides caecigallinarum]MCF2582054.1 insulinase family protein [Bacteroides caecigallinarum]
MNFWRKSAAMIIFISGMASGFAQQMPPIPTDPNVRVGKLENGLTYYIRHNELPDNQADFYIAQKVGSILEEDNQRGLAHFLEHMCFNGTTNYPGNLLREYLEGIGVKFGANLNAYTSIDETVYNISNVPVTRETVVDSCLLILHDWANDLTLDHEEIDKERKVIHEEWRTRTGAMMRMYEKVFPVMFKDSKYAYRLPIGTMEVVDNFPYQALKDYYEKWYRPDQQGIIVVGDIDVDKVEEKIKKMFSPIEMPENAAERKYFPVPDNDEPIIAVAKDKEQQVPIIYLFHKHEAVPDEMKNNMGYLAMNYMTSMVGNMLNARLEELTQKPEPPFIQAFAEDGIYLLAKTKGAFMGLAVAKEDGILTSTEALMTEIERVRQFGFTASEYARAKADYLRALESAYNERDKMRNAQYVNEYVRHFIDNEPMPGIENEYAIMNQIVPNIPVDAINQMLKQLIGEKNIVLSVFCPEKEGMKYPTEAELKAVIDKVKAAKLEAYVDKVSDEPLMKELPAGGKVVKSEEGPFGSKVLTLSNGVKVVMKKTDFKADEVRMQAFSTGGTSMFDDKDVVQFKLINQVAGLGGLGNFSNVDLDKVLAGKMASASAYVNSLTEGISGSCSPKDMETMLQLTYLRFTAPRMDQDAFTSFIGRNKAALANAEADPNTAFSDSISVALYNRHPRAISIKAETLDKIDYSKVMELYKDRFADASDFTFVMVGNIDEATATPLIEKYLGSLPSTKRNEKFRDVNPDIRKGMYENNFTREMETAKSSVLMVASGKCEYTQKNVVMMSMLGQLLNILYTQTVREEAGGTYGVSCNGQLSKYPEAEGVFQIYFDTDPERRPQMVELINKGISDFIAQGPKAEDLNKVKEYMMKTYQQNQKENSYWMGILNTMLWEGVDMNKGYENTVNGISIEDLKKFAKDFFGQKNMIEVSMSAPVK